MKTVYLGGKQLNGLTTWADWLTHAIDEFTLSDIKQTNKVGHILMCPTLLVCLMSDYAH